MLNNTIRWYCVILQNYSLLQRCSIYIIIISDLSYNFSDFKADPLAAHNERRQSNFDLMLVDLKILRSGFSYLCSVHPSHQLRRKKPTELQLRICTLTDQLIRMTSIAPLDLCIILEDEVLIIVDKAANILSVPGKSSKPFTKFRCTQWEDAVREAANSESLIPESESQRCLQQLAATSSLPRKESKFKDFLRRVLKVVDTELQQSIWKRVCDADSLLNKQPFEEIPNHLVSSADLVEKHCGHKVYIVHRLDMETSGLIMYAKNEASAAELCRQFRTREVMQLIFHEVDNYSTQVVISHDNDHDIFFQIQKVYYAKVANKVLAQSQIISAPLGPDPAHPMIQVQGFLIFI